ncbi:hypothetical protein GH733_016238 [Mirounga leonina]|nr:hypothetical protein GH733_016238 [Mirounga leonina]
MEGHASELPIQLRDDLAYSLGSTSGSRDDVLGSPSAVVPQLPREAVHGLLGGSDGMDGGHESLHDAEVVIDDLGQRSQAVGGAGGIADNLEGVVILLMVHTHHKHGGIGRRSRDDDPLGPALQVSPSFLHGGEDPSGLHNILSTSITPFDVGGISLLEDGDGLSIDDKLPVLSLDCAVEFAMGGVILKHVDHVVEVNERVIDGNNIHLARVKSSPGDQAPNTAKSVHSDLHHRVSGTRLALHQKMRLFSIIHLSSSALCKTQLPDEVLCDVEITYIYFNPSVPFATEIHGHAAVSLLSKESVCRKHLLNKYTSTLGKKNKRSSDQKNKVSEVQASHSDLGTVILNVTVPINHTGLEPPTTELLKLAHKYRPQTKQEKKQRFLVWAEKKAVGKGGKARLGHLVHGKAYTTLAFIQVNLEDKGALAKLVKAVKTNYNDRYDKIHCHWGGNILGPNLVSPTCWWNGYAMRSDPGDRSQGQKGNYCRVSIPQWEEESFPISAGAPQPCSRKRATLTAPHLVSAPGALVGEGGPFSFLSALANPGS